MRARGRNNSILSLFYFLKTHRKRKNVDDSFCVYLLLYIYIAMSATTRVSPMYYIFIGDAVYYISYIIV